MPTPASEFIKSDLFKDMCLKYKLKVEDFTCTTCKHKETCPCSYDPYNTDGDCLESK